MPQILVHCNPYEVLDHKGFPCATFPFDPDHAGGARRWIGASLNVSGTQERTKAEAPTTPSAPVRVKDTKGRTVTEDVIARTRPVFSFDLTAQPIPHPASKHYRDGVRHGSLFPADAESAKHLGIAAKDYRDPQALISASRAKSIDDWTAAYGEAPPVESWPEELQAPVAPVATTAAGSPAKDAS